MCGLPPTGVLATNDVDALLALDADCVSYTATADLRPMDAINDMARILGRARTSCRARSWPRSGRRISTRRCARRSKTRAPRAASSWFTSGIDPGWANDVLPLLLAGTCEDVEQLRVMEIVNYKDYEQPTVLFETMGFGQALDAKPLLLIPGVLSFAWGGVVKVLAEGLGVEIEELREVHERRPAPGEDRPRFRRDRRRHDRGAALRGAGHRRRRARASSSSTSPGSTTTLCPDWPQPVGAGGLPRRRDRHAELPVRRADDRAPRSGRSRASSVPRAAS